MNLEGAKTRGRHWWVGVLLVAPLLALLGAVQPLWSEQAPAATPKATIRGHVYALDTGMPLKRAVVTLRPERRANEPLTTTTDAQGAFEFSNVEPATYSLSCSRSGFITASYGQKSPNQAPTRLSVGPGQELKDLDFRLIRGGVISGTILDEDGEPLSGVRVEALARQYFRGRLQLTPRGLATTDDRGQYRIFNLPPGRYYIQASRSGFGDRESGYAPLLYPNALSFRDAQRIEVTNGAEVSRVDLGLRPVPTYSVLGKVLDQQTGQPVTEGYVTAIAAGGEVMSTRLGAANQLRPDGSFQVRGLLPGRYWLFAMAGGRSEASRRSAVRVVDVGGANVENVIFALGHGVLVRGRLSVEGGSLSPERLRLSLSMRGDGYVLDFPGASATVNKDLTFEFSNVQPGEYTVQVAGGSPDGAYGVEGFGFARMASERPFYLREIRAGGQDVTEGGLTVVENAPINDLLLVLDFRTGSVTGRLLNDRDEPVSGAVALVSADPARRAGERYFRSAGTDQNGQFTVRGVIPGDYLLVAWPDSDVSRLQDPELFAQVERFAVRISLDKSATATQDARLTTEIQTIAQTLAQ